MTDYVFDGVLDGYDADEPVFNLTEGDTLTIKALSAIAIFSDADIAHLTSNAKINIENDAFLIGGTNGFYSSGGRIDVTIGEWTLVSGSNAYGFDLQGTHNTLSVGANSAIVGSLAAIRSGGHSSISNLGYIGQSVDIGVPSERLQGIELTGGHNQIENGPGGIIYGNRYAIGIADGHNTITNDGTISSSNGVAVLLGFDAETSSGTNVIVNRGLILSQIVERGSKVAIESQGKTTDTIINEGDIIGDVNLGAGADFFYSSGLQWGVVNGGDGNDRIFMGQDPGRLEENVFNGGRGNDTLSGGAETDTFVFDTRLNAKNNVDTIVGFGVGNDVIHLSQGIFGLRQGALASDALHIGTKATSEDHRILYNDKTGAVSYDADGNGAGAAVQFASLSTGLALKAGHFFVV